MKKIAILVTLLFLTLAASGAGKRHPYLYSDARTFVLLSQSTDPDVVMLRDLIISRADYNVQAGPVKRPQGNPNFGYMRSCQGRILDLAAAFRMTGDKKYVDAVRTQLRDIESYDDWGTYHFLDIGECCLAFGVAYDWLYDQWTPAEREEFAQAVIQKAFEPSKKEKPDGNSSWVHGNFNWNQVCHGGMGVAALAIMGEHPEEAQYIIDRAIEGIPYVARMYMPDGAVPEGPSYWEYGTTFQALFLDALLTAKGDCYGLDNEGYMKTADFRAWLVGNTGREYGYSDFHGGNAQHDDYFNEPATMWFAKQLGRADLQEREINQVRHLIEIKGSMSRHTVFDLLWWTPLGKADAKEAKYLDHYFARGEMPIAFMRTDRNHGDSYVAFKGGTPNNSHGHQDSGSFIFESQGVRWALDLGTESYDKMREAKLDLWNYSQNSDRWTTFRCGPESHNLLRVDGAPLITAGAATEISFTDEENICGATLNILPLYDDTKVKTLTRTATLDANGNFTLTDRIVPKKEVELSSQWVTDADVKVIENGVVLEKDGKTLTVRSEGPCSVRVEDFSHIPGIQNSPNPGVKRISFVKTVKAGKESSFVLRTTAGAESAPLYKNPSVSIDRRVKDLVSRMTLREKVLQLNQFIIGLNDNENNTGEVPATIPAEIGSLIYFSDDAVLRNAMQKKAVEETRLGIPILFGYDVIHGYRTIYPISLGQACSWDPELVREMASHAAMEARRSGIDWTFSPMIDVCRDPRWGRVSEGYGEDPYVNSVYAAATVKGYQGNTLDSDETILACLKHYVGYGASEAGRDYVYTEISRQTLWDTYLPPYKAGVEAGAVTVMGAFNNISGIPATVNSYTLNEILHDRWGMDGFVVTDWEAVQQLVNQGYSPDLKHASMASINSGVDMDMKSAGFDQYLEELVESGEVSLARVDEAVSRILKIKFRLGLFEHPYTAEYQDFLMQPAAMETASRLAAETMVLLKNEGVLPLENNRKIALIGPLADEQDALVGNWRARGKASDAETLLSGMRREFDGKAEIRYAKGCDFEDGAAFKDAVKLAKWSDVVVLCLGEKASWSGENCSRASIGLPEVQIELARQIAATGKPVVLVLSNGRPLEISALEPLAGAILEIWQPGINGAGAFAGIVSGRINPSGKLAITFPAHQGQIPIYYDRRPFARPSTMGEYQDASSEPLYPFGHGLSYTTFRYSDLKVSKETFSRNDRPKVEVTVTNSGNRKGTETVLWYVTDPACTITRPMKELRHFERITLEPGESRTVVFEMDPMQDLGYVDHDGHPFLEEGDFYVEAGGNRIKLTLK